MVFLPTPGAPEMPPGRVLEYDPPRRLSYTWGEDELRFDVGEHPDGSLLVLTHSFGDRFKAARDAAGWELCLQALDHRLRGTRPAGLADGERLASAGWGELNADYERRFGIAPEDATPPPPRSA